MKVLVVGGGGREHAVAWKLSQSPRVKNVYIFPGNGGTEIEPKIENVNHGANFNLDGILGFAIQKKIDITVVGPEQFLVDGIVDLFKSKGLKIIGPSKLAAKLEGSKKFAKSFMSKYSIPTANFCSFDDSRKAKEYLKNQKLPLVIKSDGLASGKGVFIVKSLSEGYFAIDECLEKKRFDNSSDSIIIEDFLTGEEISFIVLTDGKNIFPFPTSRDHKRLLDDDEGPNTGGMGAYSPVDMVDEDLYDLIIKTVILPTVEGMKNDGVTYTGFLYAGLMIQPDKSIKVLEFNCRLGDPEAQILMMKLKGDFFNLLELSADGKLNEIEEYENFWDPRTSLGIVVSSEGYPKSPITGREVNFSPSIKLEKTNPKIFHASTIKNNNNVLTSGGRVLCVTAIANDLNSARKNAYEELKNVFF